MCMRTLRVIYGQSLKYFVVLHLLSVGHDRQSILAQLTSYLSREILDLSNLLQNLERVKGIT